MNNATSKRKALIFWGLFILLNMILYIPNFVAYYEVSTFFPSSTMHWGAKTGPLRILLIRSNHDIFRLCAEFVLFLSFFWFLGKHKKILRASTAIFMAYFLTQLFYNIYFEFYQKFYGETPYFLNDFVLVKEVLPIFLTELSSAYAMYMILTVIGFVIFTILVIFLIKKLLSGFQFVKTFRSTKMIFSGLFIFILISTFKYKDGTYQAYKPTVRWMLPQLIRSMQLKNSGKLKTIENEAAYRSFLSKPLVQKPDIYFLFIESYGTVATLSPELDSAYKNLATTSQKSLNNNGWYMASTYSIAPVKGGRSWLSFASTLSGIKIENQLQYNDMIELNKDFPHLVRYLNYQGYQTYRMSTMSNTNTETVIPLNKTNQYWGFDHLIMYNDIPYKGYQYDYFGGLPDQYALGYFDENISKKSTSPKFLFFITMTSHGPWYAPPPIVQDWKALDNLKEGPTGEALQLKGEIIFRYQKSIEYELNVVTDFIINQSEDNSIFVLIGDHQPPTLEYKIAGLSHDAATPIHIISRDSTFVNSFQEYGLQSGMNVDINNIEYLNHQGIYSLFLRQLIHRYGEQGVELPQYFPNGLE